MQEGSVIRGIIKFMLVQATEFSLGLYFYSCDITFLLERKAFGSGPRDGYDDAVGIGTTQHYWLWISCCNAVAY
jgi:hypothetical protein